eukprot:SAG11_NODE_3713_length_2265_cov_69.650508_1_plen_53_part_10
MLTLTNIDIIKIKTTVWQLGSLFTSERKANVSKDAVYFYVLNYVSFLFPISYL